MTVIVLNGYTYRRHGDAEWAQESKWGRYPTVFSADSSATTFPWCQLAAALDEIERHRNSFVPPSDAPIVDVTT